MKIESCIEGIIRIHDSTRVQAKNLSAALVVSGTFSIIEGMAILGGIQIIIGAAGIAVDEVEVIVNKNLNPTKRNNF